MEIEDENNNQEILTDLASKYSRMLSNEDIEYLGLDSSELCVGTKLINNKRKRECLDLDKSSNVQLTAIIAQYLLSRAPLPTSRSDIQRKFLKNKDSKKIDLDIILMNINERFKSALGLGIFGLNKVSQKSGNQKYYVVQLYRSNTYLESIYQFGYINYKSIAELSISDEKTQLISPKLCNYLLSFISFLFGFFSRTSVDQDFTENNDSDQVIQINDEIEISIEYLLELISEFTATTLNNDLNILFNSRSKNFISDDEDHITNNQFSNISIILYILHRLGYIEPVFITQNNSSKISGFKNGEILKWDSNYVEQIISSNNN